MENKVYTLRDLKAEDTFLMFQIINTIGIKEVKNCFVSAEVMNAITHPGEGESDEKLAAVGMTVALDIAGVLVAHLPDCKEEIYRFLAGLAGMSKEEIAELPMNTFFEMIVDVIRKEEFKDFFQGVSRLFK